MRTVTVTTEIIDAWEVWWVDVPDNADEVWVRDNWLSCEMSLKDSGNSFESVSEVSMEG